MSQMSRRRFAALAAAVSFAVAGCMTGFLAPSAEAQQKPIIKVSSLTLPVFNPLVWNIMKARGIDAKHGFELDIKAYPSISGFYAAFATGETDVLIGGPTILQKLYQEGVPLRIIGTGFTLAGIAIGLYVFTHLSSDTLAKWLGSLVLAYGLYSLWSTFGAAAKPHLPPKVAAALGGLGGGMTGTIVGTMGSVFFAMYFDAIKLAKDSYRATMTAILLTLTIIRGVGYFAVGEFSRDVWIVTAILFPSMLIGLFLGNYFHHGMSELAFRRIVALALTVSGIALLIK